MENNISVYLNELADLKKDLADNLVEMGVTASEEDGFSTLVPKVLNVGKDSTTIIGSTDIPGNFGCLTNALSAGNFKTGNFSFPTPCSGLTIQTGLSVISGFLYYTNEFTGEASSCEASFWGFFCIDSEGNKKIAARMTANDLKVRDGWLTRASAAIEDGTITITPNFPGSDKWNPFVPDGSTYTWIAW